MVRHRALKTILATMTFHFYVLTGEELAVFRLLIFIYSCFTEGRRAEGVGGGAGGAGGAVTEGMAHIDLGPSGYIFPWRQHG